MRNNKILARFLALILACAALFAFSSCGKKAQEVAFELGNQKITVNMYRLWLSRVKGVYSGAGDDIWDEVNDDGRTYNEVFTGFVTDNAKTFVSAMHLFDELGLELPKSEMNEIDKTMKTLLDERGDGSKSTLNSYLAAYGVNYDILREVYIIEAKLDYLEEYLYGANGKEKIADEEKDEYYKENYVRVKQIFLYTANKPITDDEGNLTYDEQGNVATRDFTDAEIAAQEKKAQGVLDMLEKGEQFDSLMTKYSEDKANEQYPGGYYFTKGSQYVSEVVDLAFQLEVGGFAMVKSEYGIHIILREELDEGGYKSSANADFFTDFEPNLVAIKLGERLAEFKDDIIVHEDVISKYNIKNSVVNTAY